MLNTFFVTTSPAIIHLPRTLSNLNRPSIMKTSSPLIFLFFCFFYAPLSSNAFTLTSPSRITKTCRSRPISFTRNSSPNEHHRNIKLRVSENNNDLVDEVDSSPIFYTPADRPVLAAVDVIGLIIFALIGKSSNSADGSLDLPGVLFTAFPFASAWLVTSPLTGIYAPDEIRGDSNVVTSTALKVAKGWVVAVPLGIVLRGLLKGYVPPVPFIIVTMISTLVILAGIRLLFNFVENFFVELV